MLDKFAKWTERSRNGQAGENLRPSGCSLESTPDIHEKLISNNSQFSRGPFKDRIQEITYSEEIILHIKWIFEYNCVSPYAC